MCVTTETEERREAHQRAELCSRSGSLAVCSDAARSLATCCSSALCTSQLATHSRRLTPRCANSHSLSAQHSAVPSDCVVAVSRVRLSAALRRLSAMSQPASSGGLSDAVSSYSMPRCLEAFASLLSAGISWSVLGGGSVWPVPSPHCSSTLSCHSPLLSTACELPESATGVPSPEHHALVPSLNLTPYLACAQLSLDVSRLHSRHAPPTPPCDASTAHSAVLLFASAPPCPAIRQPPAAVQHTARGYSRAVSGVVRQSERCGAAVRCRRPPLRALPFLARVRVVGSGAECAAATAPVRSPARHGCTRAG